MYTAEGTLVRWLVPPNTPVKAGQAVAEVETEKATYELEAAVDGILHPIATVGTVLPVEALLGYLLAEGEAPPATSAPARPDRSAVAPPAAPAGAAGPPRDVRASPIARRLATEHGIDLRLVTGSGPEGRIVEADVLAVVAASAARAADAAPVAGKVQARIPLTGMRGAVADRLRRSLSTAASITITREVRATILVQARSRMAANLGTDVPYDALFIKLFAAGLREYPIFNATIEHDTILILDEVHIGFAVALSGGLIVPVVHHADVASLPTVARTVQELTARARGGHLRPADVTGGTASISNLGAFGVDAFTPILNPPESAILGIGRIAERPVVEGTTIVPGATCVMSLTFDHRVADGTPAAQLLEFLAGKMEDASYLAALST
jgi:pyruvate dehydrogenase E2 component (dihydrolipoamide acetyltransferase)